MLHWHGEVACRRFDSPSQTWLDVDDDEALYHTGLYIRHNAYLSNAGASPHVSIMMSSVGFPWDGHPCIMPLQEQQRQALNSPWSVSQLY